MEQHREEVFVYIQNSKMKLGLLTFHNAANYGAALQAYAFEKFLTDKGYDCEYINYVNASRAHEYSMSWHICDCLKRGKLTFAAAYLAGSPFMTLRKVRFDRFYKKNLRQTVKVYSNSKDAEELNDIYDFFVVGSDQVWNPVCNGDDAAFLLNFVKDGRKRISYSPSFGMTKVDDEYKDVFSENLKKFAHIGVRETVGQKIVQELTGRDATLCLDPVLLLTKEKWNAIMPQKKNEERFIFSYTNRDSQTKDFFNTGYKLNGKKHYVLSRYTKPSDFINSQVRVKYCMSPQEFLWVVNNAEMVVSASFHCIAMSIILNRQFVAITTGDEGKDERLLNLLRTLGLQDRVLREGMTVEDVNDPIDYKVVNERIEQMKKQSVDYILGVLK